MKVSLSSITIPGASPGPVLPVERSFSVTKQVQQLDRVIIRFATTPATACS